MAALDNPVAFKEAGNAAFVAGNLPEAKEAYSKGLSTALEQRFQFDKEGKQLLAVLYANRAMVCHKLGDLDECLSDCNKSLEIDPRRLKALYKRAQVLEARGEDGEAMKDYHRVLILDPQNKEAAEKASALKDRIQRQAAENSPLKQALKALEEGSKSSGSSKERAKALRCLGALCSDNASDAVALFKGGGVNALWAIINDASSSEDEAIEACKALSAACQHKVFGTAFLERMCIGSGEKSTMSFDAVGDLIEAAIAGPEPDSGKVCALLSLLFHALSWNEHLYMLGKLAPESSNAAVKGVAKVLLAGIRHPAQETSDLAMEVTVKWVEESPAPNGERIEPSVNATATMAEQRKAEFAFKQKRALWARDKALSCLSCTLIILYELLSSDKPHQRRKAGACISRMVRAIAGAASGEKQADELNVQEACKPFLQFLSETSPVGHESRLQGATRRVALATALASADPEVGSWAMGQDGCIAEVMTLSSTGDAKAQEAAAEAICACASFEAGRALLAPVVENGVIFNLIKCGNKAAVSAAASGYAKLGLVSQAMKGDSDDITGLLNVSLDVLTSRPDEEASSTSAVDKERAVEVLSFLASKSAVKEELCYGSPRCAPALEKLCSSAAALAPNPTVAFGLATVLKYLTICYEDAKKEAFRDKEVSYEQYQQMQEIAEKHGQAAKEDETDLADTPDAAKARSAKLVEAGGVMALRKIGGEHASHATKEAVGATFRHVAAAEQVRGILIQQGALTYLINLAADVSAGPKANEEAQWAIAKTLVTTNPALLTPAQQMGSILPIMNLLAENKSSNLQQFEGLLAITNLASAGEETKNRIVSERGISTLESLQFLDHKMVRRAATEAMCNLLPHEKMFEHFKQERTLKLWLALSYLGEDEEGAPCDMSLVMAATGALAMAAQAEDVAMALAGAGVQETMLEIFECRPMQPQLIHRAAVMCMYIAQCKEARELLIGDGQGAKLSAALDALIKKAEKGGKGKESMKDTLGALEEALKMITT